VLYDGGVGSWNCGKDAKGVTEHSPERRGPALCLLFPSGSAMGIPSEPLGQEERYPSSPLERGKGLKESAKRSSFSRGVCSHMPHIEG